MLVKIFNSIVYGRFSVLLFIDLSMSTSEYFRINRISNFLTQSMTKENKQETFSHNAATNWMLQWDITDIPFYVIYQLHSSHHETLLCAFQLDYLVFRRPIIPN